MSYAFRVAAEESANDHRLKKQEEERASKGNAAIYALQNKSTLEEIDKIVCSDCKRTARSFMRPDYKCQKHRPSPGVIFSSSGSSSGASGSSSGASGSSSGASGSRASSLAATSTDTMKPSRTSGGGFRRKSKSHRRKKYKSQRRRKSIKRRH